MSATAAHLRMAGFAAASTGAEMRPFRVDVPNAQLAELRQRVLATT